MEWTSESLQTIVAELRARHGDTTSIEVKSAAGGTPTLGPTLSAFGNMPEGGTIILGLDENEDFAPTSISDIATLEQGVIDQARQAVTPPVSCTFSTVVLRGSQVLVCTVAGLPLVDRPARYQQRAYLRQSDGDYVMSEQELAQLELLKTQARQPTRPDREPVPGATVDDLDADLVARFLRVARSSSRRLADRSDAEVLRRTGVLTSSGDPTLAGLYALGEYPQQFQRSLSITAAVPLRVDGPSRTRDLVHLDGPIPALLDGAVEWVRRNTRPSIGYTDLGHAVDQDELPMNAVRELIANALIHRNLDAITDSKRIEIRLLDDKLVITSPGGLWGVSEDQLGKPGGKSAVNPTLYDLCKSVRMDDGSRVIEGEGGGIREAVEAMHRAGLRTPRFIDKGVSFTVVLSRHTLVSGEELDWLSSLPGADSLTSQQRAILVSMRQGTAWTNSMVRRHFAPLDSREATRLLQGLVEHGFATMEGTRGSATYRLDTGGSSPHRPLTQAAIDTLDDRQRRVWDAMPEPRTLSEITQLTGLSTSQARRTLHQLRDLGLVTLDGGPGRPNSLYRRVE